MPKQYRDLHLTPKKSDKSSKTMKRRRQSSFIADENKDCEEFVNYKQKYLELQTKHNLLQSTVVDLKS